MSAFLKAAESASGKFVKFASPGDEVTIRITGVSDRPSTYNNQPKTNKNGEQLTEHLISGLDLNAASEAEAEVVIATDKWKAIQAIGFALKAAGASDLQVGGTLRLVFTKYGVSSNGNNPPKEWEAEYWLPEPEGDWSEEDED